ncbi:hypothetical protein Pfo_019347 [Paulownia fortunei]|nr:hypothetical protein Pfo_019347 [Paulownia fortunei]
MAGVFEILFFQFIACCNISVLCCLGSLFFAKLLNTKHICGELRETNMHRHRS